VEYVIAILLGILGSLIAAELYASAPRLSIFLINRAVFRLPEQDRERRREEWLADLDDYCGNLRKLPHAAGCYFYAAPKLARARVPATQSRKATAPFRRTLKTASAAFFEEFTKGAAEEARRRGRSAGKNFARWSVRLVIALIAGTIFFFIVRYLLPLLLISVFFIS
jgi:hypothetical protein